MEIRNPRPNPYVGPRAFETGEQLYGREREARELLLFLISQRIVLLHSPSGAGKTSLVQAGLIPACAKRVFMCCRSHASTWSRQPAQLRPDRTRASTAISTASCSLWEKAFPLKSRCRWSSSPG